MDIGVHVRAGQVVLLVPGSRRQDDVAEQGGAGHPEVQIDQEVEFADGGVVTPGHVLRALLLGGLFSAHGTVRTEQVLQEVLVALAGRTQQIRPPHCEDAGPVLLGIRVLDGELQVAGQQLLLDVLRRLDSRSLGLVGEVERVAVQ